MRTLPTRLALSKPRNLTPETRNLTPLRPPPSNSWRCVVCGYVHQGDAPPDECPVCGAPASDFEPYREEPAVKPTARKWRCVVCGYEHGGNAPPDECPLCGAGRESFEPVTVEPVTVEAAPSDSRIVIIGGGIAGLSAAEAARKTAPMSVFGQ